MNEIRYYAKQSKKDKQGRIPIYLIFQYDGTQFEYYTKEKCTLDQWDADKMKFKRSMPGYQEANEQLQTYTDRLRMAYRTLHSADELITNDVLRDAMTGKNQRSKAADIVSTFASYIDYRKRDLKKSTLISMGVTLGRLKRFAALEGGLYVNSYTADVHSRFLSFMLENITPASVSCTMKHLITFFIYCREVKQFRLHKYHAVIKKQYVPTDRMYLTEPDLLKIEKVSLASNLDRVRDAFLFQCYTGLRYSDLWRLTNRHIEQRNGYRVLSLVAQKSVSITAKVKRIEVPILPDAERILERYDTSELRLLPVLTNQKMNEALKDICKMAGLTDLLEVVQYTNGIPSLVAVEKWQCVSSHVGRHTWATLSLIKGVPLEVVSKVLGHSNLSTTMIYAKVVDEWKNQRILDAWKTQEQPQSAVDDRP